MSDLAGTAHLVLSADGDTTGSLMAYDNYTAVKAALDALEAAMPGRLVVLGSLVVQNDAALWTAQTDDLTDGSDVADSTFAMNPALTGILSITTAAIPEISGSVGDK